MIPNLQFETEDEFLEQMQEHAYAIAPDVIFI